MGRKLARVLFLTVAFGALAPRTVAAPTSKTVLIELFTSEGCSSCPAADDLLAGLLRAQPVPGVELVGLAFHVDYWDDLGWRDRFSSPAHTERQRRYQKVLAGPEVYTPQAVVDGKWECVGGDPAALERKVAEAIAAPKLKVSIDLAAEKERDVTARIAVERAPFAAGEADVWLAVAEDGLDTEIARGENAGRRLSHTAVVRALERVGTFDGGPFAATHRMKFRREWRQEALRIVVLVQERASGRVLGVAARAL